MNYQQLLGPSWGSTHENLKAKMNCTFENTVCICDVLPLAKIQNEAGDWHVLMDYTEWREFALAHGTEDLGTLEAYDHGEYSSLPRA